MPNVEDLKTSKYLKKEDCVPDLMVTIIGWGQEDMAKSGDVEELRYILNFKEKVKPLVLNVTNGTMIKAINGSDDFDNWIGTEIVLFNDLTVVFNGQIGGIRVRPAKVDTEESIGKKIVAQAYFNYTTEHDNEVKAMDGYWEVNQWLFLSAIRKQIGKDWPTTGDDMAVAIAKIPLADVLKEVEGG